MPNLFTYRVFISHTRTYRESYYRLTNYLDDAPNFSYMNYSVPEHDGVTGGNKLNEDLRNQIRPVHIVVVLGSMYVFYSNWIQFEIDFARVSANRFSVCAYGAHKLCLLR